MAYGLAAEDSVAICLVLLDGDARRSTWELILAVREYQTRHGGCFGTTEHDLQNAFYLLGRDWNLFEYKDVTQSPEQVFSMPFSIWIPIILDHYQIFYCNDEGESWDPVPGYVPSPRLSRLQACFKGKPTPDEVRALLAELGWNHDVLEYFLSGRSRDWEEDGPVEMDGNIQWLR